MPAACQTLISVRFVGKLHKYPVRLGAHLWVSPVFIQQILIAHPPTSEMLGRTVKQTGVGVGRGHSSPLVGTADACRQ